MKTRNLGGSGLKISEIAYGNWLTHGSQVEEDAATASVRQALEEGITTFDTADAYANTAAETVLGRALKGERREGLEIFTKVYWPTGPGKHNDHGLSRKHIMESINGSLRRLQTDYVDLYQAHRYDYETPLEETMEAFADVVRQGKALYIGVSEWRAEEIRAAHALARELHIPLVSNQPQYSMLWRVIEAEVVPTSQELGIGQIVWSPIAQGVLTGKYKPGEQAPPGSRATDTKGGADMIGRWLQDDVLERVQLLQPIAAEAGLTMAQLAVAWVLQNDNVSAAIIGASRPEQVTDNAKASGVRLDEATMKAIDEVVDPIVERDPAKTQSPRSRDDVTGEDGRVRSAAAVSGRGSCHRRTRWSTQEPYITPNIRPGDGRGDREGRPDFGAMKESIISVQHPYAPGHVATREDLATRRAPVAQQVFPVVQHQTAGLHWPQYVNKHRLIGGLVAGVAAIHIADMIGYWLPGIGLPKLDFAFFNGAIVMPTASASPQFFEGQLFHSLNGIVFALGYALLVFPLLGKTLTTSRNVARGVAMGMVLATLSCLWWIPTQDPDRHAGFMSHNLGWDLVLGVYVWHLAWSLALGFFFNPQD